MSRKDKKIPVSYTHLGPGLFNSAEEGDVQIDRLRQICACSEKPSILVVEFYVGGVSLQVCVLHQLSCLALGPAHLRGQGGYCLLYTSRCV